MNSGSRFILPESEVLKLAEETLCQPESTPDGSDLVGEGLNPEQFSEALEQRLLDDFQNDGTLGEAWRGAHPIALGSWGRGELCPRSDLDLLFVGDVEAAAVVTERAQKKGIKIRSRIPVDHDDWTKGVETFDMLALLDARPLTDAAARALTAFEPTLDRELRRIRRSALTAIKRERQQRAFRHDSVESFLEPNIKYGPGGLRDIQQSLAVRRLFPERFDGEKRGDAVFRYFKKFFLLVRQRLHLAHGAGDVINAYEQMPLAEWLGFSHQREFMREIQKGLARTAFYSDLDLELAKRKQNRARAAGSPLEVLKRLKAEPSVIQQAAARRLTERSGASLKDCQSYLVEMLREAVDPRTGEGLVVALFRSRLIDGLVSDFRRIVGYVQHDQYHRYPVDTHLLQAIRELKRVCKRPTILGRLKPVLDQLTAFDWKVLGWSALYHDVGKGNGGDHSNQSVKIAKRDLVRFGLDPEMIDEVVWLIDNHLELSRAAFRGNSASPKTWRELHERGVEGSRLRRLAVFTAIDIRATNRDAYTPWKERLLAELVESLSRPEAKNLRALQERLRGKHGPLLDRLDPFLVGALSPTAFSRDLAVCLKTKARGLSVACLKQHRTSRFWIRFHETVDRPGLFTTYVRALQTLGLSVRHASVLSDTELGVYDWFEIKPPRSGPKQLASRIQSLVEKSAIGNNGLVVPTNAPIEFESVDVVSTSDSEWVVSFRGRDVRGALLAAAERLGRADGVSISWAKVHTWGKQLDDVFGVVPPQGLSKSEFERILRQ